MVPPIGGFDFVGRGVPSQPSCPREIRCDEHPRQPRRRRQVTYQHPRVEQLLPDPTRRVERPEQQEVRLGRHDRQPQAPDAGHHPVPLALHRLDGPEQLVGASQRRPGGGLGEGRQVVRQPHELQRVDRLGRRRQVAQPQPRTGEGLRHRARHQQPRVLGQQRDGGGRRTELGVGLVHEHHPRRGLAHRGHDLEEGHRPGRVVGSRDERDGGPVLPDRRHRDVQRQREVLRTRYSHPPRRGRRRQQRVHRVRRLEADGCAPGAAEGLADLLQHLVAPVGRPHLLDAERDPGHPGQVGREIGPQRHGVPVGIAVQPAGGLPDGRGDVGHQRLGRRVGVLVDVELDRLGQLRRAVRHLAHQVVADRQGHQRQPISGPGPARPRRGRGGPRSHPGPRRGGRLSRAPVGSTPPATSA